MKISHVNPAGLHSNPAFSQAVMVQDASRTVYIGGQNGVTADGLVVAGGAGPQAAQAFSNILAILNDIGATQANVVKLSVHVVKGSPIQEVFGAARTVWGANATAITVVVVDGLANPAFLIEIDAVAAL